MRHTPLKVISALLLLFVFSSPLLSQDRISRREYIDRYKTMAVEDMEIYGIPASITMAQALLESDNGNSRLATQGNNHFGIKCRKEWMGDTLTHDDDAPGECFRRYEKVADSYRDHSEFLDKSPRYQELFKLDIKDYKGWAHGLKEAGYATNPQYPQLLIKIIEDNQLYLLDEGKQPMAREEKTISPEEMARVFTQGEKIDLDNYSISINSAGGHAVYTNNGSDFVIASEGDTFERLGAMLGVSASRLRDFNDLDRNGQPKPGAIVYIKGKSSKVSGGAFIHVVEQGDSLWSIAQKYGIKLKNLAKLNSLADNASITPGQQVRLM